MSSMVLSDFDGTITKIDTAEYVLTRFAQGDWKSLDKQFESGEITLEECLRQEFSLVKASKRQILNELDKVITFRPHFEDFAEHCGAHHVPLIIVSAGLDFVINHYLEAKKWRKFVTTYTPSTKFKGGNIEFAFPKLMDDLSLNFKHDLVRRCKADGHRVVYVGNGSGDYAAAKEADLSFAIKGSKLEKLCGDHKEKCVSVTDFQEIDHRFFTWRRFHRRLDRTDFRKL